MELLYAWTQTEYQYNANNPKMINMNEHFLIVVVNKKQIGRIIKNNSRQTHFYRMN